MGAGAAAGVVTAAAGDGSAPEREAGSSLRRTAGGAGDPLGAGATALLPTRRETEAARAGKGETTAGAGVPPCSGAVATGKGCAPGPTAPGDVGIGGGGPGVSVRGGSGAASVAATEAAAAWTGLTAEATADAGVSGDIAAAGLGVDDGDHSR